MEIFPEYDGICPLFPIDGRMIDKNGIQWRKLPPGMAGATSLTGKSEFRSQKEKILFFMIH
jgi:hypothetical protein